MDILLQNFIFSYINPQTPQGLIVLGFLLIWSLIWKALGLWKSARNNERIFFLAILFLNTVGILEIAYLFFFAKDKLTIEKMQSNIKSYKIQNPLKNIFHLIL